MGRSTTPTCAPTPACIEVSARMPRSAAPRLVVPSSLISPPPGEGEAEPRPRHCLVVGEALPVKRLRGRARGRRVGGLEEVHGARRHEPPDRPRLPAREVPAADGHERPDGGAPEADAGPAPGLGPLDAALEPGGAPVAGGSRRAAERGWSGEVDLEAR